MISDRVRDASYQVLRLLEEKEKQPEEALTTIRETLGLAPDEALSVKELVQGVLSRQEQLDTRLSLLLRRFDWQGILPAEKTFLRLVAWEFWSCPDSWEECSVTAALGLAETSGAHGKQIVKKIMVLARHLAREVAFRILYALDIGGNEPGQMLDYFCRLHGLDDERRLFAASLVEGVLRHREEIDDRIIPFLRQWHLHRLPVVDRTLLRMGTYEICHRAHTPVQVFINEAVELAKLYGGEDSTSFINAVLDGVAAETGVKTGSRQ